MRDWEAIMLEAKRLARLLSRAAHFDPNEAEKALGYYVYKRFDDSLMGKYLKEMSTNPPPRSNQTIDYYKDLEFVWRQWNAQCTLSGQDKASAFMWGIRIARAIKAGF